MLAESSFSSGIAISPQLCKPSMAVQGGANGEISPVGMAESALALPGLHLAGCEGRKGCEL